MALNNNEKELTIKFVFEDSGDLVRSSVNMSVVSNVHDSPWYNPPLIFIVRCMFICSNVSKTTRSPSFIRYFQLLFFCK